jgi:hypothetical protein
MKLKSSLIWALSVLILNPDCWIRRYIKYLHFAIIFGMDFGINNVEHG